MTGKQIDGLVQVDRWADTQKEQYRPKGRYTDRRTDSRDGSNTTGRVYK